MNTTRPKNLPGDEQLRARMAALSPARRALFASRLGHEELSGLHADGWRLWAHRGQRAPIACPDGEDWRVWVIMAGRGFGKTRAGAEWIARYMRNNPDARVALVAATLDEAQRIMIEGVSGLLNVARQDIAEFVAGRRLLRFRNGAEATLFSGASPESLRGPEHHAAWCDELAKWDKPEESWNMLRLGLRLGDAPRVIVTTTPRPGAALGRIMAEPRCIVTGGPTRANPHLPKAFIEAVTDLYAGTRLEAQELEGKLLTDAPGALWTIELLERCRILVPPLAQRGEGDHAQHGGGAEPDGRREAFRFAPAPLHHASCGPPPPENWGRIKFARTLIAVDPPSGAGTCGIIACARDTDGIAHVLADHSVTARSPEGWARAVADAADAHGTREVVAEANQGGEMVRAVLGTADPGLQVRLAHAARSKTCRAEPVAILFESGKVRLHGRFPELEEQLTGMIAGGRYEGPGNSPDRADAMVWGLTEVTRVREPRIRML